MLENRNEGSEKTTLWDIVFLWCMLGCEKIQEIITWVRERCQNFLLPPQNKKNNLLLKIQEKWIIYEEDKTDFTIFINNDLLFHWELKQAIHRFFQAKAIQIISFLSWKDEIKKWRKKNITSKICFGSIRRWKIYFSLWN